MTCCLRKCQRTKSELANASSCQHTSTVEVWNGRSVKVYTWVKDPAKRLVCCKAKAARSRPSQRHYSAECVHVCASVWQQTSPPHSPITVSLSVSLSCFLLTSISAVAHSPSWSFLPVPAFRALSDFLPRCWLCSSIPLCLMRVLLHPSCCLCLPQWGMLARLFL